MSGLNAAQLVVERDGIGAPVEIISPSSFPALLFVWLRYALAPQARIDDGLAAGLGPDRPHGMSRVAEQRHAAKTPARQGVAIADTYRIGPRPVRVRFRVENTRERRTIRNVIGVLEGTDEREQKVILSNHHDAWVYGAVDPSSGTATMIALARALGRLAREGFRPRRTIVFGEWDAEEYTLTGSTEWGEEHEAELVRNGVVCINVDASTSGSEFSASASPTLGAVIRQVAGAIADPGAPGKTVAESWRERAGAAKNVRSYASGERFGDGLPVAVLGSGSDYTVFFNAWGSLDGHPVRRSSASITPVYDGYALDVAPRRPGVPVPRDMARLAGVMALRFANADVVPLDPAAYGSEIDAYAKELAADRRPGALATASRLPTPASAGPKSRRRPGMPSRRSSRPVRRTRDGFARSTRGCSVSSGPSPIRPGSPAGPGSGTSSTLLCRRTPPRRSRRSVRPPCGQTRRPHGSRSAASRHGSTGRQRKLESCASFSSRPLVPSRPGLRDAGTREAPRSAARAAPRPPSTLHRNTRLPRSPRSGEVAARG